MAGHSPTNHCCAFWVINRAFQNLLLTDCMDGPLYKQPTITRLSFTLHNYEHIKVDGLLRLPLPKVMHSDPDINSLNVLLIEALLKPYQCLLIKFKLTH